MRYGVAIVLVVALAIATPFLDGHLLVAPPAICAVLVATAYGGIGPGLLAWLAASLAIGHRLAPAIFDAGLAAEDLAALLLYCATPFLASSIGARGQVASLRQAREDLDARASDLASAQSALRAETANRMRIEASLRESEARLGALAGSSDEIVFEFDADGRYLDIWTRNERLLFRPRDELIGRTLADIFDEGWARHHVERLRRVLATGEQDTWQYRMDLPTGRTWFLGRMNPMPSLDKASRTVACLVRDITEQKRDEQSRAVLHGVTRILAESESLAEAAPTLLAAIGENMDWDWGALWTAAAEPPLLHCEVLWHAPGVETTDFDAVCLAMALKPGEGQPGRVWQSGSAEWIVEVTNAPVFLRKDAAARAGLRSGAAFPILDPHGRGSPGADRPAAAAPAYRPGTGTTEIPRPAWQSMSGELLGIVEFFSRARRERDEDQAAMLTGIGSQVGQFMKRRRAEAELRRSEKELRDVVETIPAMVWSASPDGNVDFINRRWQEFTGLPADASLGWGWEHAIHPEERDAYVSRWRTSLATGLPFEAEVRLRRRVDGKFRWFSEGAVPLRDEQGRIRKWYGVLADIEDRKRAEYLIAQVFEGAPDGISVVGTDYRYRRVNPVYERVWRMPAEQMVGMHVADLLGSEVFEQTVKPNLDRCFAGEEVRHAQWFRGSRGRSYLAVSYSPLRPSSERVEAALVITRDLTDHALAAEALREAQAELAHVNRVATMGQLTASIAHEVNQPIAAAITNAQAGLRWLAAGPSGLEEARSALHRIVADGRRAGEVVARIRSLVKRAPAREDRLDLSDVILDVVALSGSEALKHAVSLKTDLAEGLPSVTGDRVQLQQVVLNLIMNALEAMSGSDAATRELSIRAERDAAGGVLVSVRDTGPGLGSEDLDRLFEAFYTTTKPGGMGIGLSICRSIVEAHGGRLWASANEPRGAVFQFTLPARRDGTAPPSDSVPES